MPPLRAIIQDVVDRIKANAINVVNLRRKSSRIGGCAVVKVLTAACALPAVCDLTADEATAIGVELATNTTVLYVDLSGQ